MSSVFFKRRKLLGPWPQDETYKGKDRWKEALHDWIQSFE